MATTLAFVANPTPHSLVLSMIGTATPGTKTRAEVLAACAEGPLKRLLYQTADWTIFNLGSVGARRIHVREVVDRPSTIPSPSVRFWWTATGIKGEVDGGGACQVEIRLQQSERA